MAKKSTVFQALDKAITGNWTSPSTSIAEPHINSYDMSSSSDNSIIYRTTDKEDYLQKKLELQQDRYLKDRWVKANVNLSVTAYAGLNNIKLMYRDADLMDAFPEIGAALDTYAEEACLYGGTKIKLLNGSIKTIEELYNENYKDFWVYAVDKDGKFSPSKIERVINKGKKELYKVTLDDGTEIKCTDNHMWLLSSNQWIETKDLKCGDSLMSLYDDLNYKGYERIRSTVENKSRMTHRVVAETVLSEERKKVIDRNVPHQLVVIHHKSFNKLNNDPNELQYMLWNEHEKLHTDLNQKRWENEEFASKMKKIFSDTAKKMWTERKDELKKTFKNSKQKYFSNLSKEELCEKYGRKGEQNGMFGVHRYGKLNPNYNSNINHICDINEDKYIDYIVLNNPNRIDLSKHFNLSHNDVAKLNRKICNKYGVNTIEHIKYAVLSERIKLIVQEKLNSREKLSLEKLSKLIGQSTYVTRKLLKNNGIVIKDENTKIGLGENLLKETCDFLCNLKTSDYVGSIMVKYGFTRKRAVKVNSSICKLYSIPSIKELKYVHRRGEKLSIIKNLLKEDNSLSKNEIASKLNFSEHELLKFSKVCGYKSFKDLKNSLYNHRIVAIERLGIKDTVYDLVNSSCNSCFGVKCNDGQIISHNCITNDKGMTVNVYSKSERIKSILEDLFVNRLNIQLTAPMIIRAMCKYGNQFMLLDIDHKNGVKGWKQLPVFNIERIENGIQNPYGAGASIAVNGITKDDADLSTQFIWLDDNNSQIPFRDWQIAHFRLLTNSLYLPYGVSALNAARRHWRMLSLMEDMMLIYRLERSVERRVYKIFVGAIDDADVEAYVEQIANEFKRTPIIDPVTGQVDLRKNILGIDNDIFIPVRDENAPTPIDTLQAGQNLTAMDDIKFVQNKVLTALRIPKSFLNFEEGVGEGKNLALMDIRFTRLINRIQQAFLMELTKVASIHLFLLGFNDELTNFSLTMNNPSTQAEGLEIENMQKKIDAVRDAVSDPGNGLPVMSQTRALKQIMKWSEKEIKENLEEIRLEKGIAAELEKTTQIIKKTGIFDTVDRMYGEPGAEYMDDQQGQGGMNDADGGGMGGGMGAPPPPMGDAPDMGGDMGAPGDDGSGAMEGQEGSMPTADMGTDPNAPMTPMESRYNGKPLINEQNNKLDKLFNEYLSTLTEHKKSTTETEYKRADVYDSDALLINEEFDKMIDALGKFTNDK